MLQSALEADNKERTASIVWALSNICRGKPLQSYAVCRPILMSFADNYAMVPQEDLEMVEELTWSLLNYAEGKENAELRDELIRHNALLRMVELMKIEAKRVLAPTALLLLALVSHST
jgi:hypothetical protein